MKNPTVATLLNFIPGLGYIYVGGKRRLFGIFLLVAIVITFGASFLDPTMAQTATSSETRPIDFLYLLATVLFFGGFMYDGYVSANETNKTSRQK
jgi:Kef-type K+ transport system membrane component KefB